MKSESRPAVSIIVPVYKAEPYLHYCVDSLLGQTFRDIEVLLVDDGSPDQSGAICDQYASEDDRVRAFHIENGGVSRARNYALRHARGKYITFCDSDDAFRPNTIEVCMKYVNAYDLDLFQFSFSHSSTPEIRTIEEHLPLTPSQFISGRYYYAYMAGVFIKRSLIKDLHFVETMRYSEDQLFIFQAMVHCKLLGSINQDLYFYRQNERSATHNRSAEDILHTCEILLHSIKENNLFERHFRNEIYKQLYFAAVDRDASPKRISEIAKEVGIKYLYDSPKPIICFIELMRINTILAIGVVRLWGRLKKAKVDILRAVGRV